MEKFVCIHGHFYQPPRENPWLEALEIQDSAFPYHDWNERITAECYAPNSASRILDGDQRILDIVSNYAKMSFNFGPTLLSWMEKSAPDIYRAIIEADRLSQQWRSGHGAAIAQVYNHMIMPLANRRDKQTQIIWGIRDFQYRFGRFPEGMWLAETAVDLESLDLLAGKGIKFTILAPHQAARFRPLGGEQWTETQNGSIDPTRPYLCRLPTGRTITLFFYDRLAQAVAFEKVLDSGEILAGRLMEGFSEERDWPQLLHIATDGETYGHHQHFGDMGLAATFNHIETNNLARLTNYGEYLELWPPDHEAQIVEFTSWSCFHGVERWNSNCGCNSGGHPHWNQEWRAPLRQALDWLRNQLAEIYQGLGKELFRDPWQARNDYIEIILQRERELIESFMVAHSPAQLESGDMIRALQLLEMQRHAMLMYTSCGWFFDEVSGLETVQVIQYASRALQLAASLGFPQLERSFEDRLESVPSNIPEIGNGAWIYRHFVLPARIDLDKVGAHFAFSSLFEEYDNQSHTFCYSIGRSDYTRVISDEVRLALGHAEVTSLITGEKAQLTFGVVRIGSHDFKGGVMPRQEESVFQGMRQEVLAAYDRGLYSDLIVLLEKHFGPRRYSFNDLFRDEQRKILNMIIKKNLDELGDTYQEIYGRSRPLMEFMREYQIPVPKSFLIPAQPALTAQIREALTQEDLDVQGVQRLIEQIHRWEVDLRSAHTEFFMRRHLEDQAQALVENPDNLRLLIRISLLLELLQSIPLEVSLWQLQNHYYQLAKSSYRDFVIKARGGGDEAAAAWVKQFRRLGGQLYFNLDAVLPA